MLANRLGCAKTGSANVRATKGYADGIYFALGRDYLKLFGSAPFADRTNPNAYNLLYLERFLLADGWRLLFLMSGAFR